MTTYPEHSHAAASTGARMLSILAMVFGGLAVLFLPILFGPAGIVCGAVATSKGDRLGKIGLIVAVVGMVLGFVLGALVYSSTH